jgi:succinate dehydrogenase (or fumarate reductase) cytochrome b subunit, b558 family
MANLLSTSVGKKFIMSITGLFLVLFLLVHLAANSAYLFGPEAFDAVIRFMGSLGILIMVPVLAAGFIIHIIYAAYLTLTNIKARGSHPYAVSNRGKADSWSSKNMFVLGAIVLGILVFHLTHFWAKMQLPEFTGGHAENGNVLMVQTFSSIWILLIYIAWFIALWLHLTHGFWSAFQTIGINNQKWIPRLRVVSYVYATFIALGFCLIAVVAYLRANGII